MTLPPDGNTNDEVVAGILYAALVTGNNYSVENIFITNKQILVVPKDGILNMQQVAKFAIAAGLGVWGAGGLLARRSWKKNAPTEKEKVLVKFTNNVDMSELLKLSYKKIPFEKIKEVKVGKMIAVSETYIYVKSGFLTSETWAVNLPQDEVRAFLKETPLSEKVK